MARIYDVGGLFMNIYYSVNESAKKIFISKDMGSVLRKTDKDFENWKIFSEPIEVWNAITKNTYSLYSQHIIK